MYSDGTTSYTKAACVTGGVGANGVGVSSIVEQYYQSSSATSLLNGSWSTTRPNWRNGWYIWTRTVITYTNETAITTAAICVTGEKGADGEKGNLLAGAMGILLAKPELNMEILSAADKTVLAQAKEMLKKHLLTMEVAPQAHGFYIACTLTGKNHKTAKCVIAGSHTEVVYLSCGDKIKVNHLPLENCAQKAHDFKNALKKATLEDLLNAADNADEEDLKYIKKGVEMNLKAAELGQALQKVGFYI